MARREHGERLHPECGLPRAEHVPTYDQATRKTVWTCPDDLARVVPDTDPYHEWDRPTGRPFHEQEDQP